MANDRRFQAGLGSEFVRRYKAGKSVSTLIIAQVIQVNYKYNTVDLISVKNKDIMRGAYNTEGAFSAKIPIEFGGRNSAGKPYGQVKPIEVGAMVLVGFVNEDKNNPIVLGIYGNNEVSKQLARAPFSTADYKDDSLKRLANQTFTLYPSLTYDNIDGDGNRVATFTGKTFFVTDNVSGATGVVTDDSQGTDYEDLESSYYANGELIEPMQQQAPNLLFKHQGVLDENGNKDNHNLMFHIASDGTYRTTMMNKEADWRNYFEMTPSGAVRLRRQRDSSMLGEGVLIGEIGIDREGVVYLRNGETDLEVREDGLYSNGEPLSMSVDLSEVLDKLGEHDALFVDMSTQINKTDEKVEILADKTEYYDDKIIDYDAEFVVMADLISSKVSETQVQDMIDDTLIDLTDAIREAQEDADRANQVIADMASDNKITAQEKITLLSEWDLIKNEYPLYIAQAETYEVDSSLYTAKYNAVKNFVEPILADMSATSVVDGALMRKTFSTYYDARLAIITAILRDLKDGIVEAMKDASKAGLDAMDAKAEAINAQLQAQKANELIDDIASDGVLTPVEKSQLKKEWMIVVKEYPTTLAQAEKYELDTADYTAKYNALSVFLQSLLSDMSASSVVDGEQLRTVFSNYYASRVALLKEISDSAKDTLIDYGDRIYVAETAIEQTSESIKLMATKVETIEGDVKTNSALLEVHSEQIRSKVTASEVKDAVDDAINGIQIGTSNLYVIKTQTAGLLNENDGTVGNAVDKSVVSDYIKVKATNPYVASLFENTATNMIIVAWYDSSKVFLSGKAVSGTEDFFQAYKSPEKASYVRVSYKHSDKAKMKFEIGTKPSDYSLSWEDIKGDQDALNDYIQKVEQDAEKAQQEAENAKNSAENANNAIADMSNDNLLTPSEKQQLLLQWEEIQAEYDKNIEQATKFSVSTTQYASAYTALKNLLTPLLADLTVNSVVIGSTIRSTFKTYYDRRTTLLNRVAEIAKSLADTAQDTADKLNDDMNNIGGYNYVGFSSGDNMYPRLMIDNVGYYSGTNANLAFSADKVSIKPKTTGTAWGYYLGTTDETKARFGLESYRLGDIETGKWLTFTANVQTYGGNAEIRLYTHNGGSNWLVAKSNVITPTSGLVRITAQAQLLAGAKAVALQICPASGHESKTTEILFSKVQLEVGIRPTPWKKSDIDIQEDINNVAKELQDNIDNAVSLAEQAQIDADKAQESADTAKANADKANNAIADIASDNKVTAVEKKALKKEWDTIVSEYPEIVAQATKFSVAYSNYSAKYTALNTFITPILADLSTTSAVVGATLRSTFKVYYDERTKLLNAVATRAKELADSAQARADQAVTDASKAQETADSAKTNADKANSAIADIANDNKVTAVEKKALKKEWDTIVSEKPVLIAQASKFGVTPTNYTAKYTALETFITPILANLATTSAVTGTTLRSTFKSYYDERTALLNVIAVKAKELADKAQAEAEGASSSAKQAQETADKAVADAKTAQTTADTAKANADKANNAIADIASDNKVTAVEKKALKKEWETIVSEKPTILEQATKFGVASMNYSTKYTALETFITPILANLATTSAVTGATLRATFKAYYDERTKLLNAIAVKAKELADNAQNSVDSLKATKAWANSADGTVDFTLIEPGENLILGSSDFSTGALGSNTVRLTGADGYNGHTVLKTTVPANSASGYIDAWVYRAYGATKTGKYTLKFKAKASVNGASITSFFYNPNTTTHHVNSQGQSGTFADGRSSFSLTTEWQDVWVTWTQDETTSAKSMILGRCSKGTQDIDFYMTEPKLVEGDFAGIYTPSPEDDLVGSVMKYVGTSIKPSNDPKDFVWVLNSDYVNSDKQEQINGKEGTWIYQPTAPTNPSIGMVWVDTTKTPYQPKRYTGDETGWVALTPEEVADLPWGEDGSNLADWVAQAEQIISADSIINTVLGSEDFTSIFDSKASTEDLTGLASYDDLENMQAEYERILEEGINGIDFSPYVTNSELEQLKDSFNFTVQQAGGVNMLRNSLGFSGMDFWDGAKGENLLLNSSLTSEEMWSMTQSSSTGTTYGISNGEAWLNADSTTDGKWKQWQQYLEPNKNNISGWNALLASPGKDITISFEVKVENDTTASTGNYLEFELRSSNPTLNSPVIKFSKGDVTSQYQKFSATAKLPADMSTITAYRFMWVFYGVGKVSVKKPKLELNDTATSWTPNVLDDLTPIELVTTTQNDDLSNLGFGSGFQIDHHYSAVLQQNVQLPEVSAGLMYGMSFYMNVQATAKGVTAGVKIYESGTLKYTVGLTDSSDTLPTGYNRYALVFEPESTDITIGLFVNNGDNANVIISGVMLNIGNLALKWQPYPSEIYNTNVKIDINGITVRNNQTDGYTMITPQEFSGYARVNGEMERIFTLNGEVTEVRMLRAEQRITMEPITIFAMDNEINRGWAFVSSSES